MIGDDFNRFFNDTATAEIYTLSLHDALPICERRAAEAARDALQVGLERRHVDADDVRAVAREHPGDRRADAPRGAGDRKSTRLNSSHANISYAVFCLKIIIRLPDIFRSPSFY